MEEIVKIAADYIKSRHVVFLLDCCFSGFIAVKRGGADVTDGMKQSVMTHLSLPCRYAITARTHEELSATDREVLTFCDGHPAAGRRGRQYAVPDTKASG